MFPNSPSTYRHQSLTTIANIITITVTTVTIIITTTTMPAVLTIIITTLLAFTTTSPCTSTPRRSSTICESECTYDYMTINLWCFNFYWQTYYVVFTYIEVLDRLLPSQLVWAFKSDSFHICASM